MREMKGQSGEVEQSKLIKKVTDKPHLVFINNAGFDLHYDLQDSIHDNYWATLLALVKSGYEISVGNKALILAAAWAHKDHVMADRLLALKDHFGLVEVIKALSLLDSGRKIREWEKKLRRMELQKDKPKKGKLSKCKQNIENLKSVQPKVGSVSGALIRHIKKWVHLHTKEELEYFALFYPKENWKKLADICHLNPKKDFQVIPWFLPHCFGEAAPDGSLVQRCSLITAENVNELVSGNEVPFSHIKSLSNVLNDASKVRIATYSKNLSTVLWNYEDLACSGVDEVLTGRLENGEEVDLTYGKLMERLLMLALRSNSEVTFMSHLMAQAEQRLKNIKTSLEAPVAVLGDRSPSMSVAIRTSTIIASLMANITQAKLSFFAGDNYDAEVPKTVKEVLHLAKTIDIKGATAPAASLLPYYQRKEVVKTFVLVTDEEENTPSKTGYMFTDLFEKYHKEVSPANLVFVSFLRQNSNGQMVPQLQRKGFDPMRFRFDSSRPDLTKLDAMLARLSIATDEFKAEVAKISGELEAARKEVGEQPHEEQKEDERQQGEEEEDVKQEEVPNVEGLHLEDEASDGRACSAK